MTNSETEAGTKREIERERGGGGGATDAETESERERERERGGGVGAESILPHQPNRCQHYRSCLSPPGLAILL